MSVTMMTSTLVDAMEANMAPPPGRVVSSNLNGS
jgi:hypothetical protein